MMLYDRPPEIQPPFPNPCGASQAGTANGVPSRSNGVAFAASATVITGGSRRRRSLDWLPLSTRRRRRTAEGHEGCERVRRRSGADHPSGNLPWTESAPMARRTAIAGPKMRFVRSRQARMVRSSWPFVSLRFLRVEDRGRMSEHGRFRMMLISPAADSAPAVADHGQGKQPRAFRHVPCGRHFRQAVLQQRHRWSRAIHVAGTH
jgi:hypothetical protein